MRILNFSIAAITSKTTFIYSDFVDFAETDVSEHGPLNKSNELVNTNVSQSECEEFRGTDGLPSTCSVSACEGCPNIAGPVTT